MQNLGVPYEEGYDTQAEADARAQAAEIFAKLGPTIGSEKTTAEKAGKPRSTSPPKEIIALIAYLQRLGTDIKAAEPTAQQKVQND